MASANGDHDESELIYSEDGDVSDNFEVNQADLDDSTNGLGGDGDGINVDAEIEGAEGEDDPELEAIKARVREMEEEAEKLKEMQSEVEKQMNLSSSSVTSAGSVSLEEKLEADSRSIYVGNVDYCATAEELEAHFHGCGAINRVTIMCDKFSGHPKGFGYIEFADKDSVTAAVSLDDSLFRGRQIKVSAKRTNRPGISTTNRPPRGRGRGRGYRGSSYHYGYQPRSRGSRFRSRGRASNFYAPY